MIIVIILQGLVETKDLGKVMEMTRLSCMTRVKRTGKDKSKTLLKVR